MELTIKEALQQAIEAHKVGKLQDAERLYRAIIESQPLHPDANHNLGVLSVSVNKADAALQLFKTALESNPKIEQFWLSYIGALLKEKQFENAIQVIEQAKIQGVAEDKLNVLETQVTTTDQVNEPKLAEQKKMKKLKKQNLKPNNPSQQHISNLIEHYQAGRFSDAEKLAKFISQQFPNHQFAWKVLGVIFGQTGRNYESAHANEIAVALSPQDAEARSNLGNSLKVLGKLEEAVANYAQAITLDPDYAEAHSNLGVTLKEMGRLDEAVVSFTQAITLKSDFAEAMFNLSIALSYMNNLKGEIVSLQDILQIGSNDYGLRASVNLAICYFLNNDFIKSKKQILAAKKIQEKTLLKFKQQKIYHGYLLNILKWHEEKYYNVKKEKTDKHLYVLGESHSLTSHNLRIQNSEIDFFCSARLIKGCKQWHLGNALRNQYKYQFETIFCSLPKHSYILLAIGEIDCRLDSGIITYKRKYPEKQIKDIILTTVANYLTYIENINSDYHNKIIIQGVPCPNIDIRNHAKKDIDELVELINIFNFELKTQSKQKGFGFLDIHQLTDKGDGLSNSFWHIDDYHISPEGMQEAWRKHCQIV